MLAAVGARILKVNSVALVTGKTIHLWKVSKNDFLKNERWLKHELAHVHQYKQYGYLKFLFIYLYESFKNGYRNNRFEVEARAMENESFAEEIKDIFKL